MIKLRNYRFREGNHRGSLPVNVEVYKVNDYILAFVDEDAEEVWCVMDACTGDYGMWILHNYDYENDVLVYADNFVTTLTPRLIDLYNMIENYLEEK